MSAVPRDRIELSTHGFSVVSPKKRHVGTFDELVDRSAGPTSCHPWVGAIDKDGYGLFGKKYRLAHRIACEQDHGPPPFEGAEEAHSCDNPPCCNGAHLSWKTHAENVAEQFQRGNHRNCQLTAARLALGLTTAGAEKASRRARRLGARLAAGSITLRQLRASMGGAR